MLDRLAQSLLLNPPALSRTVARLVLGERHEIAGKTVLLTGASSGVGRAAAYALGRHGARLILVARTAEPLLEVRDAVRAAGGVAESITCDLSEPGEVDDLVKTVLEQYGTVDVLVNNAGRSIRRRAAEATDRFHDYERTMALNYFGAARLTMGLLPSMLEAGNGHVVNVATWGVAAGTMPMFTAYHASKAALGAFGRSLGAETRSRGVHVTTVGFPLVRTEMIAPTGAYDESAALTAEQAADWICTAIRTRPIELYPRYTRILQAVATVSPRAVDAVIWRLGI
ncbi:SDR family oxidoreductase [Nocardia rhizosphaerihabitans]|uniref:Oxidoreductase n=1 Tax=Nocardia rhizosphaerihabitans TaxID=1691570 RepID=A0ABQ2K5J0_9NOCA|nr:SDR family oxidoreductase [Nocardia rhizosphaerihabitans]GGN66671.1 oxidoreductase [Nocardia rhizosphaerihabitans]